MENHADGARPQPQPGPEQRQGHSAGSLLLGILLGALAAGCVVVGAIITFDANPAGPVIVVVAAITAGSLSATRVPNVLLKSAAIGLVVGGIAAILFWPFFDVG